ncbi:uncharacterized protein LOC111047384 isoform X5 [Nilaparvata lugens]|uniref:uncharacterized protein LOC111047384 isoform X5 n=1 Tax=Nilaparvata lugens TaxID=108931 RepID=UPI00193DA273|nr:uncharacterized protein LOC111047384 isoform X5 [Nilaparvata lugens]XP_039299935.1 uncharacterized protein LOC111047384 isoform X5 [Nilaparvata lugens]
MSLYLALSISEEEEEEEEEGTFSPAELAESLSSLKPHQVMVIGSVVLNQIVVGLAVSYLSVLMCGIGVLMAWRGFSPLRQLPTFHWVCAELALHITLTAHSQAAPRVDGSNLSYRHLLSSHRAHIQQSVAALPRGVAPHQIVVTMMPKAFARFVFRLTYIIDVPSGNQLPTSKTM